MTTAVEAQTRKIKRLLQIETWVADGLTSRDIVRKAEEENWGLKKGYIIHLIGEVKQRWAEQYDIESKYNKATAIQKRERLYQRVLAKGDLKTALHILDSIGRLQGLFIERIETYAVNPPLAIAIQNLRKQVAAPPIPGQLEGPPKPALPEGEGERH
jgi:hypothetical protein